MNNDYLDPTNSENLPDRADALFAMDCLIRAKNGVRNCAYAIAETATPEARTMLRKHLQENLAMHEQVAQLMIKKHWLHPHHLSEQYKLDILSADEIIKVSNLKLYPDNTTRIGMFATPDK